MKLYVVYHRYGFSYIQATSLEDAWQKAKQKYEDVSEVKEVKL